jgi:D-glycerate 3-kinase
VTLLEILRRSTENHRLRPDEIERLYAVELSLARQASLSVLQERLALFSLLWPSVWQKCRELGLVAEDSLRLTLWRFWLPLAMQLRDVPKPFVQGILAPQGTGKTTLTAILQVILQAFDLRAIGLSIDDLYKTYAERQKLRESDSRFIWRGPPGTHDVDLGLEVLDRFRRGDTSISLPRFNKALHQGQGDRISPEIIENIDILLFEGWMMGMRPLDARVFEESPEPIDNAVDRQFARDCNDRLKVYLPLWEKLDRLMILYPLDYRWSLQWRQEAEPWGGMSYSEIEEFVKYFWKSLHPQLFLTPLLSQADWVVEINRDRSLGRVIQPDQIL